MSEYESQVAQAMNNVADALRTLAAVGASIAATAHTNSPYDQQQFAAVIWTQAQDRFGDVLKKLNKRQREDLERFISGICKGAK